MVTSSVKTQADESNDVGFDGVEVTVDTKKVGTNLDGGNDGFDLDQVIQVLKEKRLKNEVIAIKQWRHEVARNEA